MPGHRFIGGGGRGRGEAVSPRRRPEAGDAVSVVVVSCRVAYFKIAVGFPAAFRSTVLLDSVSYVARHCPLSHHLLFTSRFVYYVA